MEVTVSVESETPQVVVDGDGVSVIVDATENVIVSVEGGVDGATGPAGPTGPTGPQGPAGSLAGSAFGIGIARPSVVADTVTPFSYCPFAFRIDDFKQGGVATGSFTLALLKNGTSVWSGSITTTPTNFSVGAVSFAAGDSLALQFTSLSGTPTLLAGTFTGVRL